MNIKSIDSVIAVDVFMVAAAAITERGYAIESIEVSSSDESEFTMVAFLDPGPRERSRYVVISAWYQPATTIVTHDGRRRAVPGRSEIEIFTGSGETQSTPHTADAHDPAVVRSLVRSAVPASVFPGFQRSYGISDSGMIITD